MSTNHQAALTQLRTICLALPGSAERLSHGMEGFHIEGGKFFAYFWNDHHGDGETSAIVKTSGADEQTTLIERDPDLYYKPPYFGPSGWIAIRIGDTGTDWDHVGDRVAQSWEMVAPRRLLEAGGR